AVLDEDVLAADAGFGLRVPVLRGFADQQSAVTERFGEYVVLLLRRHRGAFGNQSLDVLEFRGIQRQDRVRTAGEDVEYHFGGGRLVVGGRGDAGNDE